MCGPYEIVHLAVMQGELAARAATGRPAEPLDYDSLTSVVFTDPQLARAGRPASALVDAGIDFLQSLGSLQGSEILVGMSILAESLAFGFIQQPATRLLLPQPMPVAGK